MLGIRTNQEIAGFPQSGTFSGDDQPSQRYVDAHHPLATRGGSKISGPTTQIQPEATLRRGGVYTNGG
jgi:hypothetical protein